MGEAKEKLESRKAELESEFAALSEKAKDLQGEIAAKQRELAAAREAQLRIQGAYAELLKLLEPSEP
jgi:predicted  nucleic acid-binding Zn-ribbon protein